MKILFDHQIFAAQKFGGVNRYFNELSKADQYSDVETEIIDVETFPKFKTDRLSNFIRYSVSKFNPNSSFLQKDIYPKILMNRIFKDDYDIFHPTYYDPYFLDALKKPFVLSVYDMIHEIYPEYFGLKNYDSKNKKIVCKNAASIISISETTKNDLIDIFKIEEEKITCILLASNFHELIPNKPELFIEIENYILFTGVRNTYKNFYFMVQNLAEFLINDKNLKLVCTGYPFSDDEITFFMRLGVEKQIIHVFSREDSELAWLYQNALCFIFPSLYEGFGFPLLEAFASKCPIISSDGGSLREIGGKGVFFFNPKNSKELKIALSDVLFNSSTRMQLVKNGNEEYKKYSWDKCRSETMSLYKKIL